MILIERNQTDPYFNIAAEEFILKNFDEDIVMLWQSEPSVIIGKHQNSISEINLGWIKENQVAVIRRLTGGGTVYHDMGNINYTVIRSEKRRDRLIDFFQFTRPVVNFLDGLGIKVDFNGKNNLFIGDKKISGNAAHVHKNRVMHHGTLLFNSNLNDLNSSITTSINNITDRAVQSVRSTVTNIRDHLATDIDTIDFKAEFRKYMMNYHHIDELRVLGEEELNAIHSLAKDKYQTWEWTFGYSPNYSINSTVLPYGHQSRINMVVEKGIIKTITLDGNNQEIKETETLLKKLIGLPHHPDALDPYLREITKQPSIIKLIKQLLF